MNRPTTLSVRTQLCGVNANAWGNADEYVRTKTNAPFDIFLSLDGHGPNGVERTAGGAWLL